MKKRLQNTSITFRLMQHCLFRPTGRSRNKVREIPGEEAVTTYDYSAHMRHVRMMRTCARSGVTEAKMN